MLSSVAAWAVIELDMANDGRVYALLVADSTNGPSTPYFRRATSTLLLHRSAGGANSCWWATVPDRFIRVSDTRPTR